MSASFPSYLMKKSYSYYARIRVPKDINQKFRLRSELRFSLKTNNVTDAKSRARLVAGWVQLVFRNIRNGGYLSVLNDEQIKVVKVWPTDTDRYGRTIAFIFVGSTDLNKELLKAGLAWHYKQYSSAAWPHTGFK